MRDKKAIIEDNLIKLMAYLQREFETHYLNMDIAYCHNTRMVSLLVSYSLSPKLFSITTVLPKKITKELFAYLEQDYMDRIYDFINTTALRYDTKYGKQHRITKWLE